MLFPLYLSLLINIHKNKLRHKYPPNSKKSECTPLLFDYNTENLKYDYKPFFNRYTPISPYKKYTLHTLKNFHLHPSTVFDN